MRKTRRSGVTAITAAIALALGAVPVALTVPAIVASGEASAALTPATALTPGAISAGAVVLTTTSTKGTITYQGMVQEFTGGQQCQVQPIAGGSSLLAITGSVRDSQSGVAGFRDGDIGVFETNSINPSNASQCSRVDFGSFTKEESLTLTLPDGSYPDAPFSDRLLAESATVNARVANTRDGNMIIDLLKADGTTVLKSTSAPWSNRKAGEPITIPAGALQVAGNYNAIRLRASAGSFTLRGATLNLVSQADEEFCLNETYVNPSRTTTSVTFTGGGDDRCFGITLKSGNEFVQFLKPSTVSTDAQFMFSTTWIKDNLGGDPSLTVEKSEIAFDLAEANFKPMKFCSDFETVKDSDEVNILGRIPAGSTNAGMLRVNNYDAFLADNVNFEDFELSVDSKQWACTDTRSLTVTAEDITVDDTFFVVGDMRGRLP